VLKNLNPDIDMIEYVFTAVPHAVVFDTRLSSQAFRVYCALMAHSGRQRNRCCVMQRTIAKELAMSDRSVKDYVQELKQYGLIRVERRVRTAETLITDVTTIYGNCDRMLKCEILPVEKDAILPIPKGSGMPSGISICSEEDGNKDKSLFPGDSSQATNTPLARESGVSQGLTENTPEQEERGLTPAHGRAFACSAGCELTDSSAAKFVRKPYRAGVTAIDCSHRRTVEVDATSGQPIVYKKKSKKKALRDPRLDSLWAHWRLLVTSRLGVSMPLVPVGKDLGHLKNILKYCDFDPAKEMMEMVLVDWTLVQARFPVAKAAGCPTLYVLDTLKRELHSAAQGGSSLTQNGVHRHANWVPKCRQADPYGE